jgi:peptide/nickel transport system permease protein
MELRIFIVKRMLLMLLTLFVLVTLVFIMFRVMPGNPASLVVSPALEPEAREALLHQFGLDKPIHVQYWLYVKNLARGDMGHSFRYRRPVVEVLRPRFTNTVVLIGPATLFALILGVLVGGLTASRRAGKLDTIGTVTSLALKSLPTFWTSIMALIVFAYRLKWVPSAGLRTPGYTFDSALEKFLNLDFLHHLVLPLIILTLHFLAEPLLTMRNSMLEVQGEDFVEMARAKGIGERRVIYNHWVRNALLPVVSIVPMMVGHIIGGQVLVETVFSWPGLGREIVHAVNVHDYPLAQASFLMIATVVIGLNFLADITYAFLDPRVRLE